MKTIVRLVGYKSGNSIGLIESNIDSLILTQKCLLSIDGSTTRTGISVIREQDGAICASLAFEREGKETAVAYKVRLKREVYKIITMNPIIQNIYYEEPFIGYAESAAKLLMLRTFLEELTVEYEPQLNYLNTPEINNKRWKKIFLYPEKCPSNSELEKKMVRDKVIAALPFMADVSQDEIDAYAMGFVAATKLKDGDADELESKKKVRPFQYNAEFIGAEDDDVMIQELFDTVKVPQIVLENGISLVKLPGIGDFDKKIYEAMGHEDKLVIAKFSSRKHGNIILKYRIGELASMYDYIYAVVWRKSRK